VAVGVKICGLREPPALDAAVRHGARMVGFVFFDRSPRNVSLDEVAALARHVPEGIERVGVTVDAGDDRLGAVIAAAELDIVQFHGSEDVRRLDQVRTRFGVRVMKVIRVATAEDLESLRSFDAVADMVMFDAMPPREATRPGGNAATFDWTLLAGIRPRSPWILSGGLDAGNLHRAVEVSGATTVDVSSGVETSPGHKSASRIAEFMEQARVI